MCIIEKVDSWSMSVLVMRGRLDGGMRVVFYCLQMFDSLSSRPLPCWVRSHGRPTIFNKIIFLGGVGDRTGWFSTLGSPVCIVSLGCLLSYLLPLFLLPWAHLPDATIERYTTNRFLIWFTAIFIVSSFIRVCNLSIKSKGIYDPFKTISKK